MENKKEKDSVVTIMGFAGLVLVILGTIIGLCNTGKFGIIIGVLTAFYIMWVITTMILSSLKKEWSANEQAIIAFCISLFIMAGLFMM